MSEKEKELAATIAETLDVLPEAAKQRWIGYAEGVADMRKAMEAAKEPEKAPETAQEQ